MTDIVTIVEKTVLWKRPTVTFNDRGDTSEVFSTVTTTAEIQPLTGDENIVRQGILRTGDAIGFFKPTDDVQIGDIIAYQNVDYRVTGVIRERIGDVDFFVEAQLKKEQH